ncbi:hypothetical protein O6H91_01G165800 [Diphasiastrum complanatum]|uniref:Uncharacterized protein n=1 Tax=Diphasiastrum complanatum TaxID=34168 RepID=A0ACC2EYH8_DIPCM|nr:hypothetical protein O6H91_Y556300 [Diphasiastrum complanatum]KAJ7571533.1 hypothetical protein O6H91_01G165800 [Diphasiastrum complanatum]
MGRDKSQPEEEKEEEKEEEEVARLEQEVVDLGARLKKVREKGPAELRLLLQESLKNKRPSLRTDVSSNEAQVKEQALQTGKEEGHFEESLAQIEYLKSRLSELISALPDLLWRINNCTHELDKRMKKLEKRKKSYLSFAEDALEVMKDDDLLHSLLQIKEELGLEEKKQRLGAVIREAQVEHI